jgi:hypothetical protein
MRLERGKETALVFVDDFKGDALHVLVRSHRIEKVTWISEAICSCNTKRKY